MHASALAQASQQRATADSPDERRQALALEVAALNSLGRSAQALNLLDEAQADLPPNRRDAELRTKVLLPLGRCDEALPDLEAAIGAIDVAAAKLLGVAYRPGGLLPGGAEPLLALAYCHAANRRMDAAVAALARVFDPMDPSLMHYRAAWYAALRKLGAAQHAGLDADALQLPARAGLHDIGLSVVQGRADLQQALRELQRHRLDPASAQDALAELLFFAAVAADAPQARQDILARLDALAPFGSTEWVMARLLFAVR